MLNFWAGGISSFPPCAREYRLLRRLKEARLLNTLRHQNIVSLKGRCSDRYALLLEYVYFDLKPFGVNEIVNCLQALLDKKNCAQIDSKVFYHAAKDIASGFQFLHENGISHRDLKPANILVSNQQYCHLSNPVCVFL